MLSWRNEMRKRIFFIMCMAMVVLLCACEKKESTSSKVTDIEQEDEISSVNSEIPETSVAEKENKKEKEETLLTCTYKVPLQEIYIDTPNYNLIEEGYTRIFYQIDEKYIAFTCMFDNQADNVSEAHNIAFQGFIDNIYDHHRVVELEEIKEKTLLINGIETFSFEGTVRCGWDPYYSAFIKGYSFVYNGFPCSLVGVVMDKAQTQEEIESVSEMVEAMMESIRNER